MNCRTNNLFTRGMVIAFAITLALTLCFSALPASARVQQKDNVSVAGDLDDLGIRGEDVGGGGAGTFNQPSGEGLSQNVERLLQLEKFLLEYDPFWISVLQR